MPSTVEAWSLTHWRTSLNLPTGASLQGFLETLHPGYQSPLTSRHLGPELGPDSSSFCSATLFTPDPTTWRRASCREPGSRGRPCRPTVSRFSPCLSPALPLWIHTRPCSQHQAGPVGLPTSRARGSDRSACQSAALFIGVCVSMGTHSSLCGS